MNLRVYKGLFIILTFLFLGEVIVSFFKIPVPGNVIGMILMTLSLLFGVIKVEDVEEVGYFLIRNMSIMFIPPGVGIVTYWYLVKAQILPISITLILSFIITIITTAFTVEIIRRFKR